MHLTGWLAAASTLAVALAARSLGAGADATAPAAPPASSSAADSSTPTSSAWLSQLPDGEEKRRFILDCTGCHQFDAQVARIEGRPRSEAEWAAAVARMLGYAGAKTPFPVISADRDPEATARWLAAALAKAPAPPAAAPRATVTATSSAAPGGAEVREFMFPAPQDLPHDVAIDSAGWVVVTGMFSHRMYQLDTATGRWTEEAIPVDKANPRAVEVDGAGNWWVVLGGPNKVARRDPMGRWESWDVGVYAHSIALDRAGRAWVNGHFTRDPELLVSVRARGNEIDRHELVQHPTLATRDGGPVPYELRAAPDGSIWMSELQGNRMVRFDPATRRSEAFELPTPHSGPRRFDIDRSGVLWIPGYAANTLVRLDPKAPAARRFEEIPLPLKDALPYVVRVDDERGIVWVGSGAADAVIAYRPSAPQGGRFTVHPLPSRGAMIRHMTIDPRTRDLWLAYGASPGRIPARVARLRVR
jgi:streptogramin lyase